MQSTEAFVIRSFNRQYDAEHVRTTFLSSIEKLIQFLKKRKQIR